MREHLPRFAKRLGIHLTAACLLSALALGDESESPSDDSSAQHEATVRQNANRMIQEGRRTFRFDTFGDEAFYQLAIPAPRPPPRSFDRQAARRGEVLFNGAAQCATCHVPPLFT